MKLSQEEASTILFGVALQIAAGSIMRFGQMLFNLLPEETAALIQGTDNDFYYWVDDDAVFDTFFKYCVEE